MRILCCTKRSETTFVSHPGVRNGDVKVYQMTPWVVTCTCCFPRSSQSSFSSPRLRAGVTCAVTHLDGQVLSTEGDHDSYGRQRPAGLVGLDRRSHGVLQRGKGAVGRKTIRFSAGEGTFFYLIRFGKYGRVSYLEEFKEHVIEVRGDVGDLDGPPDLVGCRAKATVSALCTHTPTHTHAQ